MTEEKGMDFCQVYEHAISAKEFGDYLRQLRKKYPRPPIALFMDNLAVHRSKDVKPLYKELNITPIYNIGYSPEFNPIEAVFSRVKGFFN